MRISKELEKSLLQVEENSADNVVTLLDLAIAFENTYRFINTSFIADEKEFDELVDGLYCKKERYDAVNGKTIYSVKRQEKEASEINVAVSNNGEISFEITSENREEAEELINLVNAPSNNLLQLVRMNADVSFFTENKELVFSEKPYLALKMGNFVEGDKAVLVYKEDAQENELNKKNTGFKYIRIDQIEGYLKNIKIDERTIPVLAYAYYGLDYSDELKAQKYNIKESTYPKLTEEKVEYYTNPKYMDKLCDATLSVGLGGGFALGIAGGIIGAFTALPALPCILVGAGVPIATSVVIYNNGCKKAERSENKEELIKQARLDTYSALKDAANENINYQEKEFTRKRAKKIKPSFFTKTGEKIKPTDTIREVKNLISNAEHLKTPLYEVQLAQILNVYSESTKPTRDNELIEELSILTDEIQNGNNTSLEDLISMTFTTVKRLSENVNVNESLNVLTLLNNAIEYIAARKQSISNKRSNYVKDIVRANFEIMLQAKANDEEISIETLASIDNLTRSNMVNYLIDFASRVKHFDDEKKSQTAHAISANCLSNYHSEVKILKSMNLIAENDLTSDLLGKKIKEKVKTKVKLEE